MHLPCQSDIELSASRTLFAAHLSLFATAFTQALKTSAVNAWLKVFNVSNELLKETRQRNWCDISCELHLKHHTWRFIPLFLSNRSGHEYPLEDIGMLVHLASVMNCFRSALSFLFPSFVVLRFSSPSVVISLELTISYLSYS